MSKDFRYTMPDGSVVEGFQMTEDMRYQEKKWPEWMNSRYLVTYDHGEHRLNINDVDMYRRQVVCESTHASVTLLIGKPMAPATGIDLVCSTYRCVAHTDVD